MRGFWLRVLFVVLFALVMQFYYGTGDTFRYYISILDIRNALGDGAISVGDLIGLSSVSFEHPLSVYFELDELGENHYYMRTTANFTVPKIGTFLSFIFFKSYISIALVMSFFALFGMYKVYKVVIGIYPSLKTGAGFACFFIPTVIFWSSGILKDSLTLGGLGVFFGGAYDLFVRRKKVFISLFWMVVGAYLLYTIKPYILVILAPAMVLLVFTMFSHYIQNRNLRRVAFVFLLVLGVGGGALIFQNLTSDSALDRFSSEQVLESIEIQRSVYESEVMQARSGSSFSLGTSNPILALPLGIVASYFRPFPWELSSPIMLLNVAESMFFVFLLLYSFKKLGVFGTFRRLAGNPLALFCLVFCVLFGMAVGTSTGNFGTLVRYKIPGMGFYVLMFLIIFHESKVKLPPFFKKFGLN